MLSFSDALKVNWYRRFSTNGRAARSEFWWMYLTYIVINMLLMSIMRTGNIIALICLIISLVTLTVTLCCAARRLHDRNLSAWWLLIIFVPLVGQLVLLIICALPGTQGSNRFGPDPLQNNFYPQILAQGNSYQHKSRFSWEHWRNNQQNQSQDQNQNRNFNPFGGRDDFGDQLKAQRRDDDHHNQGGGFAP